MRRHRVRLEEAVATLRMVAPSEASRLEVRWAHEDEQAQQRARARQRAREHVRLEEWRRDRDD